MKKAKVTVSSGNIWKDMNYTEEQAEKILFDQECSDGGKKARLFLKEINKNYSKKAVECIMLCLIAHHINFQTRDIKIAKRMLKRISENTMQFYSPVTFDLEEILATESG